jgi:hypothetical protein
MDRDNIATDPELGMNTTAGSLALGTSSSLTPIANNPVGAIVPGDAPVITNLRKAGAISKSRSKQFT